MTSREKGVYIITAVDYDIHENLTLKKIGFDKFDNHSKNKAFKEAKQVAKNYSGKFDHVYVSEVVYEE